MKPTCQHLPLKKFNAATFGWLCVETHRRSSRRRSVVAATFGWLCVETTAQKGEGTDSLPQPPSGGCVLKHRWCILNWCCSFAATFGWLCVETLFFSCFVGIDKQPPSGGCVLKHLHAKRRGKMIMQPPSGGCVLKHANVQSVSRSGCSHLRVAVC